MGKRERSFTIVANARRKGASPGNRKRPTPGQDISAAADRVRQNIRAQRKARKLTALEMASRTGFSRPFYTQLEGGTRRMRLEYLLAIAKALGMDVRDLFKE
jgi:DNA-binding XRE family transcriptional regulator